MVAVRSILACAALALAACEEPAGEEVTLSWAFGPGELGCDAAGVQTVHVFIGPLAPVGSFDQEVQCFAGERSLSVRGVSAGPHVLVLKGLAKDKVLFTLTRDVDVGGGNLGRFVLEPYAPPASKVGSW
jgi:hypothetical protein